MTFKLPSIIGHRGVKDLAPENTMPSVERSLKYNLKWIEVDVQISKDGIPFLLHDDLLNRTTTGKGYAYNFLYNEILKLDAGYWFDKKFINTHPPSLEEVLIFCSKNNIGLNVEIKSNKEKEKESVNSISSVIINTSFEFQYFISSFNYSTLELMRHKIPNVCLGYLIADFYKQNKINYILQRCIDLQCFSIGFDIKIINKEVVKIFKNKNIIVNVFSSNSIEYTTALELWNIGVNSIFIDNPIGYKNILDNDFSL